MADNWMSDQESKQIIIDHVNKALKPINGSGKGRLRLSSERLRNIGNTKLIEIANERLKLFEEKMKNLGFPANKVETMGETYKEKLVKFIGAGLREYLLRQDNKREE